MHDTEAVERDDAIRTGGDVEVLRLDVDVDLDLEPKCVVVRCDRDLGEVRAVGGRDRGIGMVRQELVARDAPQLMRAVNVVRTSDVGVEAGDPAPPVEQ